MIVERVWVILWLSVLLFWWSFKRSGRVIVVMRSWLSLMLRLKVSNGMVMGLLLLKLSLWSMLVKLKLWMRLKVKVSV